MANTLVHEFIDNAEPSAGDVADQLFSYYLKMFRDHGSNSYAMHVVTKEMGLSDRALVTVDEFPEWIRETVLQRFVTCAS